VTQPYPTDGTLTEGEVRLVDRTTVNYADAVPGDLISVLVGSIESAAFTPRGTLDLKLSVPFDSIGDPTELMRSQGRMLVVEMYRL
jgi:hypothetical protein